MSVARILLDTNVLSELMRPRPEPLELAWFSAQNPQTHFVISAITQAEILLGIALPGLTLINPWEAGATA